MKCLFLFSLRGGSIKSPPSTPSRRNNHINAPTAPETPRRRKDNALQRLRGINTNLPLNLSLTSIRSRLISRFSLSYTPDDWQIHLIRRILQGYDSIFCAGTGYGKSLIFEGLAVLSGNSKLVIVISPLKALEYDQLEADQAVTKGIEAIVLNEDTTKTSDLWKRVRTTAAMVYISPEMALSESFYKMWKDSNFRKRLTAVIVDEAHCIDEWGEDDFRPLYRKLNTLRNYTGYEIPIVACTATARTSTFDLIWTAFATASSDIFFLSRSTVRPETHRPTLLSMVITRELVPLTLKNSPRMSGKTFVARLRVKASKLELTNIGFRVKPSGVCIVFHVFIGSSSGRLGSSSQSSSSPSRLLAGALCLQDLLGVAANVCRSSHVKGACSQYFSITRCGCKSSRIPFNVRSYSACVHEHPGSSQAMLGKSSQARIWHLRLLLKRKI